MKCSNCSCEYENYGQRNSLCRNCKRQYDRNYHSSRSPAKKKLKQEKQKERLVENRKFILNYLSLHPCICCGESDPVVLEFDHIDTSTKEYTISDMVSCSKEVILAEINKCRVLCANCHRRHTAKQLNWYNFE